MNVNRGFQFGILNEQDIVSPGSGQVHCYTILKYLLYEYFGAVMT